MAVEAALIALMMVAIAIAMQRAHLAPIDEMNRAIDEAVAAIQAAGK
jgi:hypothetical protein